MCVFATLSLPPPGCPRARPAGLVPQAQVRGEESDPRVKPVGSPVGGEGAEEWNERGSAEPESRLAVPALSLCCPRACPEGLVPQAPFSGEERAPRVKPVGSPVDVEGAG